MSLSPIPSLVFDATQLNFEAAVIQASFQQPVLVDFWAAWCAPCRQLGPILEKLADEYAGSFHLAKVDTEAEMQLASVFGIRSLPTVVMVKDGQMVDGFMGALPESGVREFLTRHGIAAGHAADNEEFSNDEVPVESPEESIARLQQEIAAAPDKPELKIELAQALMLVGNAESAEAELDALPPKFQTDNTVQRLRGQLDFARALLDAPGESELRARLARDGDDHAARDLLGIRLLLGGDSAAGLDEFLHILQTQRGWNDGLAKKRLIAAFNLVTDEDLVSRYRRKMASLLF